MVDEKNPAKVVGMNLLSQNLLALRFPKLTIPYDLQLELPFLCQIDERLHAAHESAYWCPQCEICLCGTCYATLATLIESPVCPHCQGPLTAVLGLA